MSDHSELKKLAEAATPGKRSTRKGEARRSVHDIKIDIDSQLVQVCTVHGSVDPAVDWFPGASKLDANAEFIAATDPTTVLALIAEVEALHKDADRFRFIEQDASSGMSKIYGDDWLEVVDQLIGMGDKS